MTDLTLNSIISDEVEACNRDNRDPRDKVFKISVRHNVADELGDVNFDNPIAPESIGSMVALVRRAVYKDLNTAQSSHT